MDAPEDHERAALFKKTPNRIPSKSIPGMNAYADDIASRHRVYIQRFQCFVTQDGIPEFLRRRRGQNEQPTRRDNGGTESAIAWVD
ncbi:MAG: hypothetical protein ACRD45_14680 [Bryobacteraceae bacterium]